MLLATAESCKLWAPVVEGIHPNVNAFDPSLVCCGYGSKEALALLGAAIVKLLPAKLDLATAFRGTLDILRQMPDSILNATGIVCVEWKNQGDEVLRVLVDAATGMIWDVRFF